VQSDIARLMTVVVQHLYNDRDVFIRELREWARAGVS
jgi:HSP90 family molecular chaperone